MNVSWLMPAVVKSPKLACSGLVGGFTHWVTRNGTSSTLKTIHKIKNYNVNTIHSYCDDQPRTSTSGIQGFVRVSPWLCKLVSGKVARAPFFPPTIAPSWRWARPIYMISPAFAADKPFSLLHLHHSPSPPHQSASHFAIARARLYAPVVEERAPSELHQQKRKKKKSVPGKGKRCRFLLLFWN